MPAIIGAVVIGTVATVVAAVVPALKACRVAPIEAVADSPSEPHLPWQTRILNKLLVGVGGVALIFGLLLLGDIGALERAGSGRRGRRRHGSPRAPADSVVARRGRGDPHHPHETRDAVTDSARAMQCGTGHEPQPRRVLSFSRPPWWPAWRSSSVPSRHRWTVTSTGSYAADLVVDSGTFTKGGLPGDLIDELRELPAVVAVSGWQPGRLLDPRRAASPGWTAMTWISCWIPGGSRDPRGRWVPRG
ncbi:MAG: hypothetical protein V9E94_04650 [Microthrixaceae bacterium]